MKKPLLMSVILLGISFLSLLSNMVLARELSLDEYGVATSLFSLSVFLGAVSNLGLSQYLLVKAGEYKNILYTAIVSTLTVSFLLYVVVYYVFQLIDMDKKISESWLYIGIVTLIVGFFRINASLSQIKTKYNFVAIFNGASQIIRILALFMLIPLGITFMTYNKVLMFVSVITLFVSLWYMLSFCGGMNYKFRFHYLSDSKRYGYSTILSLGYTSALSPYIMMLFGAEISAYFNFYLIFLSAASIVYNSFYNNYYLKFILSDNDFCEKLAEADKVTLLLTFLCMLGVSFFYFFLEELIFGNKFQSGHLYIYTLFIVLLVRPITSNLGMILSRKELIKDKNKYQMITFGFSLSVIYFSYLLNSFWFACIGIVLSELLLLAFYYKKSKKARDNFDIKRRNYEVSC